MPSKDCYDEVEKNSGFWGVIILFTIFAVIGTLKTVGIL